MLHLPLRVAGRVSGWQTMTDCTEFAWPGTGVGKIMQWNAVEYAEYCVLRMTVWINVLSYNIVQCSVDCKHSLYYWTYIIHTCQQLEDTCFRCFSTWFGQPTLELMMERHGTPRTLYNFRMLMTMTGKVPPPSATSSCAIPFLFPDFVICNL